MTVESSTLSQTELEAGVIAELQAMRGEDANDSGTNEETEETVETEDTEAETAEETSEEEPEAQEEQPKKKGVAKILAEKNAFKSKAEEQAKYIAELEAKLGESKETDVEYIKATAGQIARQMIADEAFYSANEYANENRESVEQYKTKHNLSTDAAYKLFLLENNPEELSVMMRKSESKKSAPPAVASTKLRAEKKPTDLSTDDLKAVLTNMYAKGEVQF